MSNFDFLVSYDPHLAEMGAKAEEYLYSDPSVSAQKLRSLCEELASRAREALHLEPPYDPKTKRVDDTFASNVRALKRTKRIPADVIADFDQIRHIGNTGAHEQRATVTEAKSALAAAHRVAAWFLRNIAHSHSQVPPYRMPEPAKVETPDSHPDLSDILTPAKEFIGTRKGKWITGILAALGITFGYHLATDEEQRWNVALVKTVRIAVFVLVLALLAVPFSF